MRPASVPTHSRSRTSSFRFSAPATRSLIESLKANFRPYTGITRSTLAPLPFHSAEKPSSATTVRAA